MTVKLLEIRDRGTCIAAMAVKLTARDEAERYLLRRSGYGLEQILEGSPHEPYVILWPLTGGVATYDPWGHETRARTYQVAHLHIIQRWDALASGDVVDVEHILGERAEPKLSERVTNPLAVED